LLPDLGPSVHAERRTSEIGAITEHFQHRLILAPVSDVSGRRVLDVGGGDGDLGVELGAIAAVAAGRLSRISSNAVWAGAQAAGR